MTHKPKTHILQVCSAIHAEHGFTTACRAYLATQQLPVRAGAPLTVPYTGQLRQMSSSVSSLYSEMHLLPTCWCLGTPHHAHHRQVAHKSKHHPSITWATLLLEALTAQHWCLGHHTISPLASPVYGYPVMTLRHQTSHNLPSKKCLISTSTGTHQDSEWRVS